MMYAYIIFNIYVNVCLKCLNLGSRSARVAPFGVTVENLNVEAYTKVSPRVIWGKHVFDAVMRTMY